MLQEFFQKILVAPHGAQFLVQFAVTLAFESALEICGGLFHTVFNRTVENCHAAFTFLSAWAKSVVWKLPKALHSSVSRVTKGTPLARVVRAGDFSTGWRTACVILFRSAC